MEELKNEIVDQETVQEEPYKSGSIHYIDSREVAKIVEKEHKNLIRDIKRYYKELNQLNFEPVDFFIESSYLDGKGEKRFCYLVTRKGCEFIAHKLTSIKGTKFSATYIDRFHEMEKTLKNQEDQMLRQFMQQQIETNKTQAEFNKLVMEFIAGKQNSFFQERVLNPFNPGGDVLKERMAKLNSLIDQTSELCDLDRNKTLHYMYQTIQEDMGVSLNSYLNVFRSEMQDDSLCNLHVICKIDRFYNMAVEMNEDVIGRKRIYG